MLKVRELLSVLREWMIILLTMVLISVFIVSMNAIPSGSMISTLKIGDHLLVNYIPFYYRQPKRGEVVVFNGPNGAKWVKRVIGMPGETIDIIEGDVYIEGKKIDESAYLSSSGISALNPLEIPFQAFPYKIPEGHYFMMGDNRLESKDSRYIGPISYKDIVGKAWIKVYPLSRIGLIE